jgi:predicted component of type VI protein secretion system
MPSNGPQHRKGIRRASDQPSALRHTGISRLMLATTQQRLHLAEAIRKVITAFDPRLARVRVGLGKSRGDQDRVLDLRIERRCFFLMA